MLVKQKQIVWLLMGLLVFVQGMGCASSYHRYSDCCGVNCRYCEPAPLPYSYYPGCVCHSKPGARYLAGHSGQISQIESDPVDELESEVLKPASAIEQSISPVKLDSSIDISQQPYDE